MQVGASILKPQLSIKIEYVMDPCEQIHSLKGMILRFNKNLMHLIRNVFDGDREQKFELGDQIKRVLTVRQTFKNQQIQLIFCHKYFLVLVISIDDAHYLALINSYKFTFQISLIQYLLPIRDDGFLSLLLKKEIMDYKVCIRKETNSGQYNVFQKLVIAFHNPDEECSIQIMEIAIFQNKQFTVRKLFTLKKITEKYLKRLYFCSDNLNFVLTLGGKIYYFNYEQASIKGAQVWKRSQILPSSQIPLEIYLSNLHLICIQLRDSGMAKASGVIINIYKVGKQLIHLNKNEIRIQPKDLNLKVVLQTQRQLVFVVYNTSQAYLVAKDSTDTIKSFQIKIEPKLMEILVEDDIMQLFLVYPQKYQVFKLQNVINKLTLKKPKQDLMQKSYTTSLSSSSQQPDKYLQRSQELFDKNKGKKATQKQPSQNILPRQPLMMQKAPQANQKKEVKKQEQQLSNKNILASTSPRAGNIFNKANNPPVNLFSAEMKKDENKQKQMNPFANNQKLPANNLQQVKVKPEQKSMVMSRIQECQIKQAQSDEQASEESVGNFNQVKNNQNAGKVQMNSPGLVSFGIQQIKNENRVTQAPQLTTISFNPNQIMLNNMATPQQKQNNVIQNQSEFQLPTQVNRVVSFGSQKNVVPKINAFSPVSSESPKMSLPIANTNNVEPMNNKVAEAANNKTAVQGNKMEELNRRLMQNKNKMASQQQGRVVFEQKREELKPINKKDFSFNRNCLMKKLRYINDALKFKLNSHQFARYQEIHQNFIKTFLNKNNLFQRAIAAKYKFHNHYFYLLDARNNVNNINLEKINEQLQQKKVKYILIIKKVLSTFSLSKYKQELASKLSKGYIKIPIQDKLWQKAKQIKMSIASLKYECQLLKEKRLSLEQQVKILNQQNKYTKLQLKHKNTREIKEERLKFSESQKEAICKKLNSIKVVYLKLEQYTQTPLLRLNQFKK